MAEGQRRSQTLCVVGEIIVRIDDRFRVSPTRHTSDQTEKVMENHPDLPKEGKEARHDKVRNVKGTTSQDGQVAAHRPHRQSKDERGDAAFDGVLSGCIIWK
jgi:hypothetical protein